MVPFESCLLPEGNPSSSKGETGAWRKKGPQAELHKEKIGASKFRSESSHRSLAGKPGSSLTAGPTLHKSAGDQDGVRRELVGGKCERALTVSVERQSWRATSSIARFELSFTNHTTIPSSLVVPAHVALQVDRPPMKVKFSWRLGGRLKVAFPTGPTYEIRPLEDRFKIIFYTDSSKGHARKILPTMVGGDEVPDRPSFEVDCSS